MAGIPFTVRLERPEVARAEDLALHPLFEGAPEDAPVAVLLEEGEAVTVERLESLGLEVDEAFADALEEHGEAATGTWAARTIPVKGAGALTILVREGESADVEDILVPSILDDAAKQLGATALAVAVPARGVVLAMDAGQKWQLVAAFSTAARMQYEQAGESGLWPGVLRAEAGAPVAVIELTTASLDDAAARLR